MRTDTYSFRIGDFRCVSIRDTSGVYPLAMFLTNLSRDVYEPWLRERGQEVERIDLPYLCLLLDTGRDRVLVDTGAGAETSRLQALLQREGIEPEEISTVILTHAHGDHVGGCFDAAVRPAFPKARYVLSRQEYEYWSSKPSMQELSIDQAFRDEMLAYALRTLTGLRGCLDLVEPETEIVPGVVVREAFGHSPGHLVVEAASAGERFLFLADAVVHPLHVEQPETIGITDHQTAETVATRRRWLEYATQTACLAGTSHFPFPGIGRVAAQGGAWVWQEALAIQAG